MAIDAVGKGIEGNSYWGMAGRACDACKASPALLFCRLDSAFLCGGCDARVHGANGFASRHERVWVCEVCEQAPAAYTCKADAATLCVTCDSDIHSANPLARRHERVPVVPFYESPSAVNSRKGPELLMRPSDEDDEDGGPNESEGTYPASWLFPNPNPAGAAADHHKVSVEPPALKAPVGYFFSEVDPYLDLDSSSMDARYDQTDTIVPVQTKTVPTAAHPPAAFLTQYGCIDVFDLGPAKPSYGSYTTAPSLSHSISSSEVGVVPDASAVTDVTNPYGGRGGSSSSVAPAMQDREARLMRYREKRKNRKFQKTIRYASRKAYAETRPRIKGRFAKRAEMEAAEYIYAGGGGGFMVEPEYGVVPSF